MEFKLSFNHHWLKQISNLNRSYFNHDREGRSVNRDSSWYWYNRCNVYKTNSLGFRMKEFEEIDSNNYILFLGCSNTFGEGLSVESTYSYIISEWFNSDCVNLGIPGGSNDTILYLLQYIKTLDRPPQYIVINWSSVYRRDIKDDNNNIIEIKPWFKNYYNLLKKFKITDFDKHFISIKDECERICNDMGVPLYQLTFFDKQDIIITQENIKSFKNSLNARDGRHPGIEDNMNVVNWLIGVIQ